ncbi:hypothetical protein [Pseudonocardia sp. TRM90224]|uniref:hypothetical protein n=1 Tax=Pseudonocardia sp. TRM90224 TaxID=2812678 RepID=UPI001E40CB5A|nr:hypothetical protein [Pseudonocardia sp. TRM90224]
MSGATSEPMTIPMNQAGLFEIDELRVVGHDRARRRPVEPGRAVHLADRIEPHGRFRGVRHQMAFRECSSGIGMCRADRMKSVAAEVVLSCR